MTRIFCLRSQQNLRKSQIEVFLPFTPLLHFRECGLIWGDVTKSLWLFKSSQDLLEQILRTAETIGLKDCSLVLSDTAAGAQALSEHFQFLISSPNQEREALARLPLHSLRDLEGLVPFSQASEVESIADFFQSLGLQSLQDLQKLPAESWGIRWGNLGLDLRKKIGSTSTDVFTPFLPNEALTAFQTFEDPCSNREFLLRALHPHLNFLFLRLEARGEKLQTLKLRLTCEYSGQTHAVTITPSLKFRDLNLTLKLIEMRLEKISFENPIRDCEMELFSSRQPAEQMDFWEPQTQRQDDLLRLQSLLLERNIESGFLRVRNEQVPEKSSSLERDSFFSLDLPSTQFLFIENSHREYPVQSEHLQVAPRPTHLLNIPEPLDRGQVSALRFLHTHPIERFDLPWQNLARDYWMAQTPAGQIVWVFKDLKLSHYFLHGYFD